MPIKNALDALEPVNGSSGRCDFTGSKRCFMRIDDKFFTRSSLYIGKAWASNQSTELKSQRK